MATLLAGLRKRILLEEPCHASRIKVSTDSGDLARGQSTNPAIAVVEPEPIACGGKGAQLHDGTIAANQRMLDTELRTVREDLVELIESVCAKFHLIPVVPGQWMRAFYSPIHVV